MVGEVGLYVGESDGLAIGLPVGLCVISGYVCIRIASIERSEVHSEPSIKRNVLRLYSPEALHPPIPPFNVMSETHRQTEFLTSARNETLDT